MILKEFSQQKKYKQINSVAVFSLIVGTFFVCWFDWIFGWMSVGKKAPVTNMEAYKAASRIIYCEQNTIMVVVV